MTKKLVKTMLVCLCLIYTFNNTVDAFGAKSKPDVLAGVTQNTEVKKETVTLEVKAEAKVTEATAVAKKEEIKEEAKKPAVAITAQEVPTISAAPTPVANVVQKPAVKSAPPVKKDIKRTIMDIALSMGVDPYVALSIAKLESGFDQRKRNPSGAVGLFQLMPSTARVLGVNPHILDDNIRGGLLYYKQLYKKFGSMELALAAYNAGPGNVAKYKGIPPFRETQAFVSKVKSEYNNFKSDPLLKPNSTPATSPML